MFSDLVIGYLFLGGTGAGALVVLCFFEFLNIKRRFAGMLKKTRLGRTFSGKIMPSHSPNATTHSTSHNAFSLPSEFFVRAWIVCLVILVSACVCLSLDLGHFDRIFNLLFTPHLSVMTIGAYALAASVVIASIFTVVTIFDNVFPGRIFIYILLVAGAISGITCAIYTGVLLSSLASVLFWKTPLLPILFTSSSLSCGIACMFFVGAFTEARQPVITPLENLARIDRLIILIELVAITFYLLWAWFNAGTNASASGLIKGELSWIFWVCIVAIGLVLPFVMEKFITYGNYRSQLIWIATAILFGGLILRFCFVEAGMYDVTQTSGLASGLVGGLMS